MFKPLLSYILLPILFTADVISAENLREDASPLANSFSSSSQATSVLQRLNLSVTQKSAIQSALLGGMQSLDAINAQLKDLNLREVNLENLETQTMRHDLLEQRMKLAEALSMEVLSVLTPEQISRLDFSRPIDEPSKQDQAKPSVRELEI